MSMFEGTRCGGQDQRASSSRGIARAKGATDEGASRGIARVKGATDEGASRARGMQRTFTHGGELFGSSVPSSFVPPSGGGCSCWLVACATKLQCVRRDRRNERSARVGRRAIRATCVSVVRGVGVVSRCALRRGNDVGVSRRDLGALSTPNRFARAQPFRLKEGGRGREMSLRSLENVLKSFRYCV